LRKNLIFEEIKWRLLFLLRCIAGKGHSKVGPLLFFFEQITNFFETFRSSELDRETVLKYNRMRKKQSPFLASHQVINLKVPNVFLINVDSELR
jgi:hypothetical protein